jgi:nucleotide-binding universal stress UspA family protein
MRWATSLAQWLDAELLVVHALGPIPAATRAEVPAPSIAAQVAATLERDWCAPVRAAGTPCHLLVLEGTPLDVLHRVVGVEGPDMLVVGRHVAAPEWGGLSTSLGVLADPVVPTLVVPEAAPEPPAPAPSDGSPGSIRLLVGIDGSAPSRRALELAADLIELAGGQIVAVTTVEEVPVFPLGPATATSSEGEADAPARAAAMLADACAPARARGLRLHTICRRGAPATILLRLAVVLDVELIAVGTHGVGGPDHLRPGSVSRGIVCGSLRPVLVAPGTNAPESPGAAMTEPPVAS